MRAKYSGEDSIKFWKRVNALPRNQGGETAYVLGCVLQDLEERVIRYIEQREDVQRPRKRRERTGP